MNSKHIAYIAFLIISIVGMSAWGANEPPQSGQSSQPRVQPTQPASGTPVYKPPVGRGLPGGRIGGGTRGGDLTFALSALAPNHTGLTLQEQPVLYWYLSKPLSSPLEFTLTDDGIKPLVEARLTPPFEAGIHPLALTDYAVKLAPGKRYSWYITRVVDPERRSRDILAGGTIERLEAAPGLVAGTQPPGPTQAPFIYAQSGLWYDAIDAISTLIQASPNEPALHKQRASLLDQAGLPDIAKYDLSLTRPN